MLALVRERLLSFWSLFLQLFYGFNSFTYLLSGINRSFWNSSLKAKQNKKTPPHCIQGQTQIPKAGIPVVCIMPGVGLLQHLVQTNFSISRKWLDWIPNIVGAMYHSTWPNLYSFPQIMVIIGDFFFIGCLSSGFITVLLHNTKRIVPELGPWKNFFVLCAWVSVSPPLLFWMP